MVWKVNNKIFAGSSDGSTRVSVKSTLELQARLIEHPAIEVAKYVGRFGWVTIEATDAETLQLALELIDDSYERISGLGARKKRSTTAPTAERKAKARHKTK